MAKETQEAKVKQLKAEATEINQELHKYNVIKEARELTPQERSERKKLQKRQQSIGGELAKIKRERREGFSKGNQRRIPTGGFETWTEPQIANDSEEVHREKKRTPKVYSHASEERFYYHGKLRTATEIRKICSVGVVTAITNPRRKRRTKAKTKAKANDKANPSPNPQKSGGKSEKQKNWKHTPAKFWPEF